MFFCFSTPICQRTNVDCVPSLQMCFICLLCCVVHPAYHCRLNMLGAQIFNFWTHYEVLLLYVSYLLYHIATHNLHSYDYLSHQNIMYSDHWGRKMTCNIKRYMKGFYYWLFYGPDILIAIYYIVCNRRWSASASNQTIFHCVTLL